MGCAGWWVAGAFPTAAPAFVGNGAVEGGTAGARFIENPGKIGARLELLAGKSGNTGRPESVVGFASMDVFFKAAGAGAGAAETAGGSVIVDGAAVSSDAAATEPVLSPTTARLTSLVAGRFLLLFSEG